ncbi:MAG: nuclear transport factor 2 family protein, partial [Thermoleophilaceae bacterium]
MTATAVQPHQDKRDFLSRYWTALITGDLQSFAPLVHERCVVHYPGNHFLSGDYHGRGPVVDLYTKLYKIGLEQGTFVGELHDMVTSDDHACALIKYRLELGAGQSLTGQAVGVFHLEDGQMIEYWLLERDQKMINDIFKLSGKPTLAGAGKGALALSAVRHPGALFRT